MKLKLTDITPAEFACGPFSSCPGVFKTDGDTYIIVGKACGEEPELRRRVGPGETAIEISAELLEAALGLCLKASSNELTPRP